MKKILLLLFILNANNLFAQVYNYDPIRHSGFETNPSYLASDKTEFSAMIKHTGSYQTGKFYSDEINISKYNQNRFVGLGLVVNNSRINDSARYQYAGIGSAYRIILFNKIYTRIGFLANMITSLPASVSRLAFSITIHFLNAKSLPIKAGLQEI